MSSFSWRAVAGFMGVMASLALGVAPPALLGEDWRPVTPADMAIKDDPQNPGAPAIILYREETNDDVTNSDREYERIKILKEEGKKYADIEIPFIKDIFNVRDIEARVIQPDGKIIKFEGQVFEKPYSKSKSLKILAKTITLPGVQVGSILDYRFRITRDPQRLFNPRWTVQGDLSIREAHYKLIPYSERTISWVTFFVPQGRQVTQGKDRSMQLHLENVPAMPEEESMPPEATLKARVLFYYLSPMFSGGAIKGPDDFWKQIGRLYYKGDDEFIGKRKEIQRLADEVVKPEDPADTKLRKLYARAQQIRNLSYERSRTEKEERKEKIKENSHSGDVLKNGYGTANEINQFFAALARAAGFEASIAYLTTRDDDYFESKVMSTDQLETTIVHIRQGGQEWYLDPAARFSTFGLLPWSETATRGILPSKDGFTYVTTPAPKSAHATINRETALKMDAEGTLEGKAKITFSGREAYQRRVDQRSSDAVGRRKALEDEVKAMLPGGATVELTNSPAWESSDEKLETEFKLVIPHHAAATGRRLLLPICIFQAAEKYPFRAIKRIHPIYFDYPSEQHDAVTVELPAGFQVESLPAARMKQFQGLSFEISRTSQGNTLHLSRKLAVGSFSFPSQYYSTLRVFYDNVRAGDEEQIVLKASEGAPIQ